MQIVPVLDIKGGIVVRAVGGRRSEYRPVVSRLTTSVDPLDVAQAICERYCFTEFYIADLDAIGGARPALDLFDELRANDFRIWVDSGVRDARDVERIAEHADIVIIGSENGAALFVSEPPTLVGGAPVEMLPPLTWEARQLILNNRLVFSLDLRHGIPLGDWKTTDSLTIAERAIAAGIQRLIVLDLARVGMGTGTGTEALARKLIHRFALVDIFIGGGIRSRDDIQRLESLGVRGVLVASALHDELL